MAQADQRHFTAKSAALLAPRDLMALMGPPLSEKALADPNLDVDAAMGSLDTKLRKSRNARPSPTVSIEVCRLAL